MGGSTGFGAARCRACTNGLPGYVSRLGGRNVDRRVGCFFRGY
jgi:hypothetical protein